MTNPKPPHPYPVIDPAECVLCEICIEMAPAVFTLHAAGYIDVCEDGVLLDGIEAVEEAIKNCPCRCITWQAG